MSKFATLLLLCTALFAQQKGTFIDVRDGKTYKTVKIGEQVWMAENLNYEAEGFQKCYNDSIAYCRKYGRLYNWEMAMKVCPSGWHLPSSKEWEILYRYTGSAGKFLKTTNGWNVCDRKSSNGEDKYGFSALPGGYGYSGGNFYDVGNLGYWWSSSKEVYGDNNDRWEMYCIDDGVIWTDYSNSSLLSVRCVKDR